MTDADRAYLYVVAGPNGAGKTTFVEQALSRHTSAHFINADIIQRDELGTTDVQASYEAARIARERRAEAIANRQSFIFESVFSHPSKLDEIRDA